MVPMGTGCHSSSDEKVVVFMGAEHTTGPPCENLRIPHPVSRPAGTYPRWERTVPMVRVGEAIASISPRHQRADLLTDIVWRVELLTAA